MIEARFQPDAAANELVDSTLLIDQLAFQHAIANHVLRFQSRLRNALIIRVETCELPDGIDARAI
jgi:hypothetical protein